MGHPQCQRTLLAPSERVLWQGTAHVPPWIWWWFRIWRFIPAMMAVDLLHACLAEPLPARLWWFPTGVLTLLALFAWFPGRLLQAVDRRSFVVITDRRLFFPHLSIRRAWPIGAPCELRRHTHRNGTVTLTLKGHLGLRRCSLNLPASEAPHAESALRTLLRPIRR